jgi:23S rRNA (cytidine1920-2'-O)/16S rRNA (cytidine1409-2'-O)-methyltransferase
VRAAAGARKRLDVLLVERGLAPTREKAQSLVMAGRVLLGGRPARKPGAAVRDGAPVEVRPGRDHVGRGALKLAGALDRFGLSVDGVAAVDVGASTGGFTEVLLERGARRVFAVDVGRGQLHESLRRDPRVTVRDRVNARALGAEHVDEPCRLAVVDVSFISVLKVLPALAGVLAPEARAVVLVKPQFEVGRGQVARGGLVTDPALHHRCLEEVARGASALGFAVLDACPSPITGAEGNREFFLLLGRGGPGAGEDDLAARLREVAGP